jgi:hypothetical protein
MMAKSGYGLDHSQRGEEPSALADDFQLRVGRIQSRALPHHFMIVRE